MYSPAMHRGASEYRDERQDQRIACACAVLAHALLFVLLTRNGGGGDLGSHRGNHTGRGDSLTVYPTLLTPTATKATSDSPTTNPANADASLTKSRNAAPSQNAPTQSPEIERSINLPDMSMSINSTPRNRPQHSSQVDEATPSDSASTSNGGYAGDDLLTSYQAAMRAAILKTWQGLSNHSFPAGCTIHLSQTPGGNVTATSAASCGLPREDQLRLEAAALMAQPMPYAGYESVFSIDMDLIL